MQGIQKSGSFFDRNEIWFYRPVEYEDIGFLYEYLQNNKKYYNGGEEITRNMMEDRFANGFYDSSFIISDSSGLANSGIVLYSRDDNNSLSYEWGSCLFFEGKRNSVCVRFLVNYWYTFSDTKCLLYNTDLLWVIEIFKDLYGSFSFNEEVNVISRSFIDPNNIIKMVHQ
jgi:hypothetical protein